MRAYNEPPPGYKHPSYLYVVTMCRGDEVEVSEPMSARYVDAYIGRQHKGFGWQYISTEQRPA